MKYTLDASQCRNFDVSSRKEWILTNGIGGFAMGTVSGANTRRYHGHLVASIHPPTYRTVLLANVEMEIQSEGNPIGLSCNQYQGAVHPEGYHYIEEFTIGRMAYWRYRAAGMVLEKRLAMQQGLNSVSIQYKNAGKKPFALILRPLISHKYYHDNFRLFDFYPDALAFPKNRTVIEHAGVGLVLRHDGARRQPTVGWYYRFEHQREIERGLDPRDDLFCPCELRYSLGPDECCVLTAASSESPKPVTDWDEPYAGAGLGDALKAASERFFVKGPARTSIIAGYPWFTDWGRDTMISLPGLCIHTGRIKEARSIILAYAQQMKQGIIPNRLVDKGEEHEYNTVDATLWFANAIYATLCAEWDDKFAAKCVKSLEQVFQHHVKGTLFGIKVDPEDGLLSQGVEGVQLTWMDAKVGDWVVTPRHGKPVEVNGLWVNALRVMEWLSVKLGKPAQAYKAAAERAEASFESKFWKETIGYYLDTVDPDDASLRPNQLVAMSLPFGPAKGENAIRALGEISRELLTPVGLRTLNADSPSYRGRFKGTMTDLDAAYHQGTVWPWLMGPYVTALVKLTGDTAEARRLLRVGRELMLEQGLGGIAEVYDGDEPRTPGGCPWQAWSVAEWLRAWVEDVGGK